MALAELFADASPETFLREQYLKLPFARAGGCRHLMSLASWDRVGQILQQPGADVVAGRAGEQWAGKLPASLDEARAVLAAGYMLGIRHSERHDAGLAALAAGFQADFLAPIDIHLFCTPADHPGYGWHYDAEEVFMLQLAGRKEWWLRKNTVNPWPLMETLPADMRYDREIMPVMRCTLQAGDWLYVPAGYWHRTQSGEESISLSVGVQAATAMNAFDFLRTELLDSLRWRQRLPPAGAATALTATELQAAYETLFAELGRDLQRILARPETAAAYLAARRKPRANSG